MLNDAEEQRSIIRMLGAVLGDVIREQDGEDVFRQIEDIRRASVAFHREPSPDAASLLSVQLSRLSVAEAVRFVHSFTTFLQVTNLAEDHLQRRRGRAGDDRPDTLAGALRTLAASGKDASAALGVLSKGLIAPVITAHPSEVRRKSCATARPPSPTISTHSIAPYLRRTARRLRPISAARYLSSGARACCAISASRLTTRSRTLSPISSAASFPPSPPSMPIGKTFSGSTPPTPR